MNDPCMYVGENKKKKEKIYITISLYKTVEFFGG
jgi:hypothetical protein